MKKMFQLNLLLLLVSSATAQESHPQRTLHVYDWKDLQQQHELSGGEVISMDGMSVLKIENTNDTPQKFSLLKISEPSDIKKAYFLRCEVKYDVPLAKIITMITNTDPYYTSRFPHTEGGVLELLCQLPPAAPGGDGRISEGNGGAGNYWGNIHGESNWKPLQFAVDRNADEGLPTQLEMRLTLPGRGTVYLRPIKLLGVTGSWWPAKQAGLIGGAAGIFGGREPRKPPVKRTGEGEKRNPMQMERSGKRPQNVKMIFQNHIRFSGRNWRESWQPHEA